MAEGEFAVTCVGLLISALATEDIGIQAIFDAWSLNEHPWPRRTDWTGPLLRLLFRKNMSLQKEIVADGPFT